MSQSGMIIFCDVNELDKYKSTVLPYFYINKLILKSEQGSCVGRENIAGGTKTYLSQTPDLNSDKESNPKLRRGPCMKKRGGEDHAGGTGTQSKPKTGPKKMIS